MSGQRYAILIGNGTYINHPNPQNLRCPANDVNGLSEILKDKQKGGFDEVVELIDRSCRDIRKSLRQIMQKAGDTNLLLIYYSGHGKLNGSGDLHLIAADSNYEELEIDSISIAEILKFLKTYKCKTVGIILDCCYSGAIINGMTAKGENIVEAPLAHVSGFGVRVMTASTAVQTASELDGDKHSLFTKYLIKGMIKGEADMSACGRITFSDLFQFAHQHVASSGHQEPTNTQLNTRGEFIVSFGGKNLRKYSVIELKKTLYDMVGSDLIPKEILRDAMGLLDTPYKNLTATQLLYDNLLEGLHAQTLSPPNFIHEWGKLFSSKIKKQVSLSAPSLNYKFGFNVFPHMRWPVAWLNPSELLRNLQNSIHNHKEIGNHDFREQHTSDFEIIDLSNEDKSQELWWDFMSEFGHGGNASYAVSRVMLSSSIKTLQGKNVQALPLKKHLPAELPRGRLLILSGNLAYPRDNMEEKQYRFMELWEAAKSTTEVTPFTVLAIPQHYHQLKNIFMFQRYFINEDRSKIFNADTPQSRNYFAARLPHDWWILGFDFKLMDDIDQSQYEAYMELIECHAITAGSNIILVYPDPYWAHSVVTDPDLDSPKRYQQLEASIVNKNIKIRMRLAGDLHHYVRETALPDLQIPYEDMIITCGSGGEFLLPTHSSQVKAIKVMDVHYGNMPTDSLAKCVRINLASSKKDEKVKRQYEQMKCYPDRSTSQTLSYWNIVALFKPAAIKGLFTHKEKNVWYKQLLKNITLTFKSLQSGNIMFSVMLGSIYWLISRFNISIFSETFKGDGFVPISQIKFIDFSTFLFMWFKAYFFSPIAFVSAIALFSLSTIFYIADRKFYAFGVLHGLLQSVSVVILFWFIHRMELNAYLSGIYFFVFATLTSGILFGTFFWASSRLGSCANATFSALAHEGYKGFLRFHLDAEGNLHGYMIGSDKIPKRWKLNTNSKHPLWVEKFTEEAPEWKVQDVFELKK